MKEIPLTQGKAAIVDDEDYEWLMQWKWYCSGRGYPVRSFHQSGRVKTIRMHREILQAPDGMDVDHINTNGLDCRRSNLRLATSAQNNANRAKHISNTTGFKGVGVCRSRNKKNPYWAQIKVNYRSINLGCFPTAEEAARAYDEAARQYFGEFARTNFK